MGTTVEVQTSATDLPEAVRMAHNLFRNWDESLSRFRPQSELSALNRAAGRPFAASELLFAVVARALMWARMTDGTFDPALLHQIKRLGYDRTFSEIGTDTELPQLASDVSAGGGWLEVELDLERQEITVPAGVALDLGGIAKGMAVDAALAALQACGITTALVNAGGDLAVRGAPPDHDAWPIGVDALRGETILLRRGAMATSGVLRRRWRQGGIDRHHLLEPETGYPARRGLSTVSVIAATCEEADVAATTAFVRGARSGARFLASRGLAGILVTSSGEVVRAGAWPERTG